VHPSPGFLQYPQLSLQQTSPYAHSPAFPHGGPHTIWMHGVPGLVHMPQLALQHSRPFSQMVGPQTWLVGTHWDLPSIVLQTVSGGQKMTAHPPGWRVSRGLVTGLARAVVAARARRRAWMRAILADGY
jgi:hypothetical protein